MGLGYNKKAMNYSNAEFLYTSIKLSHEGLVKSEDFERRDDMVGAKTERKKKMLS